MRKSLIIILLLLVVSAGFVWKGTAEIYKAHDQVTIAEEILFGDPHAADGLETTFKTTYYDHIFWTTTQTMGSGQEPSTEYQYFKKAQPMEYRYNYPGISYYLNYVPDSYFYDFEEMPDGLPRAYKELFSETPAGKEREKTIRLADYVEYYPIEATFSFKNSGFSLQPSYTGSSYDHYFTGDTGYEDAIKIFNEYFRIPVLGDERVGIRVNKAIDGSYAGDGFSYTSGSNYYDPCALSALGDNRCFFTISSRSTKGYQMDMSLLPDGYGIFSFDYEMHYYESGVAKNPLVSQNSFCNAYPLDPSVQVCNLILNEEQTILYLFTMEEGYYWFTAIDADTFEEKVRMKVAPLAPKDPYGPSVYDCGEFIFMDMGSISKIAVISVSSDDKFTLEFVADTNINDSHSVPSYPVPAFAFDGKRLAIGVAGLHGYEQANYDLMIFTADGPQYWGRHVTSLLTGSASGSAYRYDVRPLDYDSLVLAWVPH